MANRLDRAAELFRAMSHPRGETLVRLAQNNPDLARQLDAAVAAFEATGSQRPLLALLSETTGLTDLPRARMAAISDAPPAKPDTDAVQRRMVREELGPIGDLPMPAVSRALDDIVEAGGGDNFIDRLASYTVRPQYSLDLLPNNRPLFSADTGFGGGGSSMDVMPGAGIPSSGGGLIVQGGRGVPVGGPTGSGVVVPQSTALSTQVTPRPALPGRGPRRLETTAGVPLGAVEPRRATAADATTRPAPRLESFDVDDGAREAYQRMADGRSVIPRGGVSEDEYADLVTRDLQRQPFIESPRPPDAPRDPQLDAIADDYAKRPRSGGGSPPGRKPPGRNAQPSGPSGPRKRNLLGAAAAAAGGAAAWRLGMDLMFPPGDRRETLGDAEMSTADLAAETSPPPSVMTEEPAPLSPRDQAHALQRKLNEMRAAAGGEVPEAQAMRREIQRLFDISDTQANAAARTGKVDPAPTNSPLQQARSILAALNSGAVPANQRASMQAEMQRLYRLADEQANARTAAPRRAG